MKTESFQVYGPSEATAVAALLIRHATWFQCEEWSTYPSGFSGVEFRFTVKHADATRIEKGLAAGPSGYGVSWNWETKEQV